MRLPELPSLSACLCASVALLACLSPLSAQESADAASTPAPQEQTVVEPAPADSFSPAEALTLEAPASDTQSLVPDLSSFTSTDSPAEDSTDYSAVDPEAGQGSLSGIVRDAESGAPLPGVLVVVEGLVTDMPQLTATTDDTGSYTIEAIPAGPRNISFSLSGYRASRMKAAPIAADQAAAGDFILAKAPVAAAGENVYELDVVEIQYTEVSKAVENIQVKFDSSSLIEKIDTETLGKLAASDVAEAIRNIKGVSVSDGKYAVVRGLDDRYNVTMLNGIVMPSPDPDRVAVPLDLFPTGIFDNIQTYTSNTPNLSGEASGGAIDLQFKGIPDERIIKFSAGIGFNSNSQENFLALPNRGDGYLFADGAKDRAFIDSSLAASSTLSRTFTAEELNGADGIYRTADRTAARTVLSNQARENVIAQQHSPYVPSNRTPSPDSSISVLYSDQLFPEDSKDKLGFIFGANHKVGHATKKGTTADVTLDPSGITGDPQLSQSAFQNEFEGERLTSTLEVLNSVVTGINYAPTEDNDLSYRLIHIRSGEEESLESENKVYDSGLTGFDTNSIQYEKFRSASYVQRTMSAHHVGGIHRLSEQAGVDFDWTMLFARNRQLEPDTYFLKYQNRDDVPLNPGSAGFPSAFERELDQTSYGAVGNLTLPLYEHLDGLADYEVEPSLKVGFALDHSARDVVQSEVSGLGGGVNAPNSAFPTVTVPNTALPAGTTYTVTGTVNPSWTTLNENSASAEGERTIYAGYVMGDTTITEYLEVVGGVRFESSEISYRGQGEVLALPTPNTPAPFQPSVNPERPIDQVDAVPSANVNVTPIEATKLRFAASKTVARPTYRELQPYPVYNPSFDVIEIGNPGVLLTSAGDPVLGRDTVTGTNYGERYGGLKMTNVTNFDVRLDWSPEDDGLYLSGGYFYKHVESPIERVNVPQSSYLPLDLYTFINNENDAYINGLEFEIRQNIGSFLSLMDVEPEFFDYISIGGNMTWINAEVKRSEFENYGFSTSNVNTTSGGAYELSQTRRLFNQPEWIGNTYINFDLSDLSGTDVTFSTNYTGDYLAGTAGQYVLDEYIDEILTFNVVTKQSIPWVDGLSVKFTVKNLTDPVYRRFQTSEGSNVPLVDSAGQPVDRVYTSEFTRGISYSMSIDYSF